MRSLIGKLLPEFPALILCLLGVAAPLGYLLSLSKLFLVGFFLQTSLWLHPFESSLKIRFICHYADGRTVSTSGNSRYLGAGTSVRFKSYMVMVGRGDIFLPLLKPYLRHEFCEADAGACPPGLSSVTLDAEIADKINPEDFEHFLQDVPCAR
jgi:hypothetical protein